MNHLRPHFARMIAAAMFLTPATLSAQQVAVQEVLATPEYVSPIAANAANIQRLNIMLMVTSLRCRQSAHDFQSEYDLFSRAHQQNLAEAHDALAQNLVAEHGEDGTARALDRIGVAIANRYGDGHPTLDCSALKEVTLQLAMSQDRTRLAQMADDLLDGQSSVPAAVEGETGKPEGKPESRPHFMPGTQLPHYGRG